MRLKPHNKWQVGIHVGKDFAMHQIGWYSFSLWVLRFTEEDFKQYGGTRINYIPHKGFYFGFNFWLPIWV